MKNRLVNSYKTIKIKFANDTVKLQFALYVSDQFFIVILHLLNFIVYYSKVTCST